MSANEELQQLLIQRESYLQRAISLLQGDERVVAAWLYGSLGRGTSDEWSDIDLWVAIQDSQIEHIRAARRDYVASLGEPLLMVEAPQNAPPGGAFLSVLYTGEVRSQHVDWTWQAASQACIPHDAMLLFNRGGVPNAEMPPVQHPQERIERARQQAVFFWMMVPVAAKYIARRQPWAALGLLNLLRYTVEEVSWLSGQRSEPPLYTNDSTTVPPVQAGDQLATLQDMVGQIERLMADVEALCNVVSSQAQAQICGHLTLASRVVDEQSHS